MSRNALSCELFVSFALNERQTLVLNRLLDGFEGKLTTSKYSPPSQGIHRNICGE
jgi:hypothetical protein